MQCAAHENHRRRNPSYHRPGTSSRALLTPKKFVPRSRRPTLIIFPFSSPMRKATFATKTWIMKPWSFLDRSP